MMKIDKYSKKYITIGAACVAIDDIKRIGLKEYTAPERRPIYTGFGFNAPEPSKGTIGENEQERQERYQVVVYVGDTYGSEIICTMSMAYDDAVVIAEKARAEIEDYKTSQARKFPWCRWMA